MKFTLISFVFIGCLIGAIKTQFYEDCEVWLYRKAPQNLYDPSEVSQILTGSQENSGTIYNALTLFRYYAFRNCPFENGLCGVFATVVPQGKHLPTTQYPPNGLLISALGCKNNFTLSC